MANEGEAVETKVEQPVDKPIVETKPNTEVDPEIKKKEEIKLNLDKAIEESKDELRKIREAKKKETGVEEELPTIDPNDPSAKAWKKEIKDTVSPALNQIEKQKDEVRTFALRNFLKDKPSLAKSPEKLKELMSNYDRLKVSSEQTQEGVTMDLEKAYGATFAGELVSAAREGRVDQAKHEMIFSDIAIDRGATSETTQKPTKRQYTAEEQKIIDGWETFGAPKVE